jgi:asparagine synthase (glutamine-hydrolysing)
MCGIVGIAATEAIQDRAWLAKGRDAMRHRGPDDAGEWWSNDGRVGFGHRRLAIVDLSPGGHQPMQLADGDLTITFNGEIYNFLDLKTQLRALGASFRTSSDTEVILAAYRQWGTDCLAHLNGMFAFALHDSRRNRLFLARDRAGEKPLFYAPSPGALRFSSELKGLLADPSVPRRMDPHALDYYLAMGYVPAPMCILQGVRKLPQAHALLFDLGNGQSRVWRYWEVPDAPDEAAAPNDAQLLDELEGLLADAVRRQLVADVPVGVLLSGGVDSSLVAAMAVRAAPHVKTFTMRFPGHGRYDETGHARLIAQHFQTDHIELDVPPSSVDLLPLLAHQFDEPVADSSMIPTYLVSKLTREHCTVALGGDGGDELFGGYAAYSRLLRMQHTQGRIPVPLRQLSAAAAGTWLPVGVRGRNWLLGLGTDLRRDLPWTATYFDLAARRRLFARSGQCCAVAEQGVRDSLAADPDLLQRATRLDLRNYMVEDILAKVDRASMLNSLEVRAPFLDYRLLEFAFGRVPTRLKATVSEHKILLKQLAARILPPEFDRQRKQGFSIPLASWLREPAWRAFFRDTLLAAPGSLFSRRTLQGLLDGQERGRSNSERLFALVMLTLWQKDYGVLA